MTFKPTGERAQMTEFAFYTLKNDKVVQGKFLIQATETERLADPAGCRSNAQRPK